MQKQALQINRLELIIRNEESWKVDNALHSFMPFFRYPTEPLASDVVLRNFDSVSYREEFHEAKWNENFSRFRSKCFQISSVNQLQMNRR